MGTTYTSTEMILQVVGYRSFPKFKAFCFCFKFKVFVGTPTFLLWRGNLTCFRTWMAKKPETLKNSKLPSLKPKTYGESKDDSFPLGFRLFSGDMLIFGVINLRSNMMIWWSSIYDKRSSHFVALTLPQRKFRKILTDLHGICHALPLSYLWLLVTGTPCPSISLLSGESEEDTCPHPGSKGPANLWWLFEVASLDNKHCELRMNAAAAHLHPAV